MTNSIRLEPAGGGSNNSANTRVFINDHDIGVLYLNKQEFEILHDVLKTGSNDAESDVKIEAPSLEEEEVDYDMFDDI